MVYGDVPDTTDNERVYKQSQEQRRLERGVRYAKRDAAMADASGDKVGFEAAARKVKSARTKLKEFEAATGRAHYSNRTQVFGYNRSVAGKVTAAGKLSKARADWDKVFDAEHRAKTQDELLLNYSRPENIANKLATYSLNTEHDVGKHKAIVFQSALGYNISNVDSLEREIRKGLKKYKAFSTGNKGFGEKYNVMMLIKGTGSKSDRWQPVETMWIFRDGGIIPRMVNAIVAKNKRP